MSLRRVIAPGIVAVAMLLVPVVAQAAPTLTTDKACYGGGDTVAFQGSGLTPGGQVNFQVDGQPVVETATADASGAFGLSLVAPFTATVTRRDVNVRAIDVTNPALQVAANVPLSIVRIKVRPQKGDPTRVRRIRGTGFTVGKVLYAHRVSGVKRKKVKTIRIGRLAGACHSISVRAKLFSKQTAKVGKYRIQFDAYRRYSKRRAQKVPFSIDIASKFGTASGAKASSTNDSVGGPLTASWTRLRH